MPSSPGGSASAAATTNRAFGRPPLRAGAAARRDASAIGGRDGVDADDEPVRDAAAAAMTAPAVAVPRSTMTPP